MAKNYLYTQIKDAVKRHLRTNDTTKKIGIGNTASLPMPSPDNNPESNRRLKKVYLGNDFLGHFNFAITWTDDAEYILSKTGPVTNPETYVDAAGLTGNILQDFVTLDGLITLKSEDWVGNLANENDVLTFNTCTDMSETDFEGVLDDYFEYLVSRLNGKVTLVFPSKDPIDAEADPLEYESKEVDGIILRIIIHGCSYDVYTTIHQGSIPDEVSGTIVAWQKTAEGLIDSILMGETVITPPSESTTGEIMEFQQTSAIFNKVGVSGIRPCIGTDGVQEIL